LIPTEGASKRGGQKRERMGGGGLEGKGKRRVKPRVADLM